MTKFFLLIFKIRLDEQAQIILLNPKSKLIDAL